MKRKKCPHLLTERQPSTQLKTVKLCSVHGKRQLNIEELTCMSKGIKVNENLGA